MHPIHKINTIGQPIEIISLAQVKDHLKIDFDYDDLLIDGMIDAAIAAAENFMGIMLHHREITLKMSEFLPAIDVNYGPYLDGTLVVEYKTTMDVVLPFTGYEMADAFGEKSKLIHVGSDGFPLTKTAFDAVIVKYTAGYKKEEIPRPIIQAILLQIGDFYEFRTDRKDISNTRAMALLRPYKIFN